MLPFKNCNFSNFAIVSRAITLERKPSKKKQKTDTKRDTKRIKSDNFTRSNREKSNIAIAILQKELLDGTIIILYFGGSNNIFADCIYIDILCIKDLN